ncbi:MAG: hypothetical protein M0R51_09245 [Clostridia bacterium]|jgi:hypothetical protein|nr:hypothetical protein [Clostridia bacterium]
MLEKFKNIVTASRRKKLTVPEQIQELTNQACLIAYRDGVSSPEEFLNNKEGLLRLYVIYTLRCDKKYDAVDNGSPKISKKEFLKLARKLANHTIDSEQRFIIEDVIYNLAEEIIRLKHEAVAELDAAEALENKKSE